MSFKNRLLEIHWTLAQRWFGVWEVRNYYTTLEDRAKAGAEITFGYVLMVMASAVLATGGLLLDSPAVVIGSMCVAPFLGPSWAVCIGWLFRNRRVFLSGLLKQLFGLLIVGAGLAYAITSMLRVSAPDVGLTAEILLRAMSTPKDVVLSIMIAIAAGAAASLALAADPRIVETPWGQVIDAVIGVEIAISLIPPASVVGIGLAFGRLDISRNALLLLLVNVLGSRAGGGDVERMSQRSLAATSQCAGTRYLRQHADVGSARRAGQVPRAGESNPPDSGINSGCLARCHPGGQYYQCHLAWRQCCQCSRQSTESSRRSGAGLSGSGHRQRDRGTN